ncbi:hypothetical protein [Rhodococcus coprophilus]|uniref:Uncharacterized protein n=1 Tax=Rhodococcus coprophilus TaxID=38310 RepID=A0A2X4U5H4_9NOCA|nr:hypothetical protein [Rhodococcus coprophilus]MBM7457815.1 hypothetical protein [Rhodococcus coprophilus]SQI30438.1 Uncharacterised protein [Rhodococcus coprophilus]
MDIVHAVARISTAVLVTVTAVAAMVVLPGVAGGQPGDRTEVPYISTAPLAAQVAGSVVSVAVPLPPEVAPHPPECDRLSYLRWRSVDGPAESSEADRIFVAQPGIFEGAGAFESVARNTVVAAAERGMHVEFWALDRRSNCLEDHAGTSAALVTGDLDTATDYYFHGKEIDGRRFEGYAAGSDIAWLAQVGLEQTLRDQYDLLRHEFPDQKVRKEKVVCGGHSMGGFITGYFAEWDFDGDPATTDDAGYNQCSGYFALDTVIRAGAPFPSSGVPSDLPEELAAPLEAFTGAISTASPVLALPAVINPETTNMLALTGLAARLDPDGVNDIVSRMPDNTNVNWTLRTLLAKDPAMFATGSPDVRSLNATNEAVLGAILDDNSQPLGFLQTSVGFLTGGPVQDKVFPLPSTPATLESGSFGDAPKASPAVYGDPQVVYRWLDYDEVGTEASLPEESRYTSRAGEVTSIDEIARNLSEPPLDFTEWYFPMRLPSDLAQSSAPSFAAHHLYRDGVARNPVLTVQASGGITLPSTTHPNAVSITLPGYNHIDVLTAAADQNDGRGEAVSQALAEFATP